MAVLWYQAVHATKRYRLGSEKTDVSGAKFIYGKGVTSLAAGDWVVFNDGTFTPVRMVDTPLTGRVAIAGAANILSTTFSWYMVSGATSLVTGLAGAVNIATTSTDKAAIAQSSTAGRALGTGVVATKTVVGAWAVGVSAANLGNALLHYPSCAGGSLA